MTIIMGEVNSAICGHDDVIKSVEAALKRNIQVRLIHGPRENIDSREGTITFLNVLRKGGEKVKIYELRERPYLHFRVISKNKVPTEVYEEEPHAPFTDRGYRHAKSTRIARDYLGLFQEKLSHAILVGGETEE